MFDPKKLYRKKEAAPLLGLRASAFDAFVARWSVPRLKLSLRAIRFRGADLNAALELAKA